MRIDIENKILIPFIIVMTLSIITLGLVSYWNGYQLLLENEVKNISKDLEEKIFFIEEIHRSIERDEYTLNEGKEYVVNYFQRANEVNLLIFDDDRHIIFNSLDKEEEWVEGLLNEDIDVRKVQFEGEGYSFIYRSYTDWGWTLGYPINKGLFSLEVLENQKYMVLIAIISLIFSMQASIFIAHNISRPIKMLADLCNRIEQGNKHEKIDIRRKDEIGMLANAFNNMVFRLQRNTAKLLNLTRLNQDILRNISAGIITTDQKGEILSINKAAKRFITQIKDDRIVEEIKERLDLQLKTTLETKKNINEVYVFDNLKEGSKIYLDATTSLLKSHEGPINGAICNFNDISERKKIESSMETLDRLTSIGQLAAGIAHEIRNPLAGMKTSIQVLKNRLNREENTTNSRLFEGVLYEIDRINHLIAGILNFAKPKMPKFEKTDLTEIFDHVLDLIGQTTKDSHIKINLVDKSNQALVFVDKAQIEQVFLNIIKNAIIAMDEEGVLQILINEERQESKDFIAIEFQDNGCGIEPKNLDKIFNPFFTTRSQGTGLGLSVVYELVKGNNGTITVHSILNQGSNFKIRFPKYGGGDIEE